MKYWMVCCERGHAGTGQTTEIKFAIQSDTLLSALDTARAMPSVKHSRLPVYGKEITFEEYQAYTQISAYERYELHSSADYRGKVWHGGTRNKKKKRH